MTTATIPNSATKTTLTITAKGQVTLKKELREALGVKPGDKVDVVVAPDRKLVFSRAQKTGSIMDVCGMFDDYVREHPLSIEEMNEVIADGWAGKL